MMNGERSKINIGGEDIVLGPLGDEDL